MTNNTMEAWQLIAMNLTLPENDVHEIILRLRTGSPEELIFGIAILIPAVVCSLSGNTGVLFNLVKTSTYQDSLDFVQCFLVIFDIIYTLIMLFLITIYSADLVQDFYTNAQRTVFSLAACGNFWLFLVLVAILMVNTAHFMHPGFNPPKLSLLTWIFLFLAINSTVFTTEYFHFHIKEEHTMMLLLLPYVIPFLVLLVCAVLIAWKCKNARQIVSPAIPLTIEVQPRMASTIQIQRDNPNQQECERQSVNPTPQMHELQSVNPNGQIAENETSIKEDNKDAGLTLEGQTRNGTDTHLTVGNLENGVSELTPVKCIHNKDSESCSFCPEVSEEEASIGVGASQGTSESGKEQGNGGHGQRQWIGIGNSRKDPGVFIPRMDPSNPYDSWLPERNNVQIIQVNQRDGILARHSKVVRHITSTLILICFSMIALIVHLLCTIYHDSTLARLVLRCSIDLLLGPAIHPAIFIYRSPLLRRKFISFCTTQLD